MNENKDFNKSNYGDIDTNMLAMFALANTSAFTVGNIGINTIMPPAVIMKNDIDEKDLTR